MKFEKRTIVVIIFAVLFLIWYLIQPFIIEGAQLSASSADTKLQALNNALNAKKFNDRNTTDPVILGEKLNLLIQRRDLLTKILNQPNFKNPKSKNMKNAKDKFQKLEKETNDAIPPLTAQRDRAQQALKDSRRKQKKV